MTDSHTKFIVEASLLPTILIKVVEAKKLITQGKAKNSSEAAKMAGISRSAFYKYKDGVAVYSDSQSGEIATYYLEIMDQPGVISPVLAVLTKYGANILTINQNIPVDGASPATVSFRTDAVTADGHIIREEIRRIPGVISCRSLTDGN